jgi:hypothetical protein
VRRVMLLDRRDAQSRLAVRVFDNTKGFEGC